MFEALGVEGVDVASDSHRFHLSPSSPTRLARGLLCRSLLWYPLGVGRTPLPPKGLTAPSTRPVPASGPFARKRGDENPRSGPTSYWGEDCSPRRLWDPLWGKGFGLVSGDTDGAWTRPGRREESSRKESGGTSVTFVDWYRVVECCRSPQGRRGPCTTRG